MKLTFRWYGEKDPITLKQIRQIPKMSGIVSAVYDTPVGEIWPEESIASLSRQAEAEKLSFEVVESVPVHEEIKLGGTDAPRLIANYCETVRRLGKAGVKVICYNFMPVFDWLRSELAHPCRTAPPHLPMTIRRCAAWIRQKVRFHFPDGTKAIKKMSF